MLVKIFKVSVKIFSHWRNNLEFKQNQNTLKYHRYQDFLLLVPFVVKILQNRALDWHWQFLLIYLDKMYVHALFMLISFIFGTPCTFLCLYFSWKFFENFFCVVVLSSQIYSQLVSAANEIVLIQRNWICFHNASLWQ